MKIETGLNYECILTCTDEKKAVYSFVSGINKANQDLNQSIDNLIIK